MPWYDYRCKKCGAVFEAEHPMAFSGKVRCRTCGSQRTEKVFSAASVHFKGSGFYVTDSKGKNSAATNGTSDDAQPGGNGQATGEDQKREKKVAPEPSTAAKRDP